MESSPLALNLLVLGVGLADHADLTLAADDLARTADLSNAGFDLHKTPSVAA